MHMYELDINTDVKWVFSKGPINFYSRSDPYYYFTNFYPACIELDGYVWPTTTFRLRNFLVLLTMTTLGHYQHHEKHFKCLDCSKLPYRSEEIGQVVKDQIMLKALRAKFTASVHDVLDHPTQPPYAPLHVPR